MGVVKLPKDNFELRLQHIGCCLADKAEALRVQLSLGFSCSESTILFQYYSVMYELLKDYTVDDNLTCEEQKLINCLTEKELENIFAHFSDYCTHCYPLETVDIASLNNCPTCS